MHTFVYLESTEHISSVAVEHNKVYIYVHHDDYTGRARPVTA